MAEEVLASRAAPWVELRRGLGALDRLRPVRTPLRFAAAAVGLCMVSACAAMLWRAAQYDRQGARYADQQREVFRRTFPRQPEPEDVPSRLASEERGLRGLSGDPAALPPQPPGLLALRDLLAALPANVRFRIFELRLEGTHFTLEGQARTHGDADAIASALRAGGGFTVEPPRTEQLAAGNEPAAGPGSAGPADRPKTVPTPAEEAGPSVVAFTVTGAVGGESADARKVVR
jgi:hypothetical protein